MKDNELTQTNAKVLTQKHLIVAKDTSVKKNLVNILYITNSHYIFQLAEMIINRFYVAHKQGREAKGATSLGLCWSLNLTTVLQEHCIKAPDLAIVRSI